MSYFFDAKFMNAKNCKIWLFLKHQFFRVFIISPIIFDLQECNIPQIKAKDILFWPHFLRYLAKINTLRDRKQWSCLIFFYPDFSKRISWSWVKVWTLIDLGIVNKAFGGNTSDEVLQEWITDCDCDGDDKIDFGEFVGCRLKHAKKEKHGLHDLFEGV